MQKNRIIILDIARTLALVAMIVFHFAFDLMLFGYTRPGLIFDGFWPWFANIIAGSFLLLAGISLWLAHGKKIRKAAFIKHLFLIIAAALCVSIATYLFMGNSYVRWGVLHMISAASVIGLLFLNLPSLITLLCALLLVITPWLLHNWGLSVNNPWLIWLGFNANPPPMVDYLPVFPWLAPFLIGIAIAKCVARFGLWQKMTLSSSASKPFTRFAIWPGQHSLLIYIVHQPILFGGFIAWQWVIK